MTLVFEPPGIWRAVCDTCGEERVLETDDEDARDEAEQELRDLGWQLGRPEQVRFTGGMESTRYSERFENDSCPDCA